MDRYVAENPTKSYFRFTLQLRRYYRRSEEPFLPRHPRLLHLKIRHHSDLGKTLSIGHTVQDQTDGLAVVYGGGLKTDNAEMLASIDEIDGGLIALTRFKGEIGFYPDEYIEIIKTYLGENK